MNGLEREAALLDRQLDPLLTACVDAAMTGLDRLAHRLFVDLQAADLAAVRMHAARWVTEQLEAGPAGWKP